MAVARCTRPGICSFDPKCPDKGCPGRWEAIEMRRQSIRAVRHCDGGESVNNGKTRTACAWCVQGICRAALSAEFYIPEPAPQPARPSIFQRIAAALRALPNPF